MSHVTDTILTFACLEDETRALAAVNEAIEGPQGFVLASDHEPQREISGGNKWLQINIALAAFNFVGDDQLIDALRLCAWKDPESVHLFVNREDDEKGFSELFWRHARKGEERCKKDTPHPFACCLLRAHAGGHEYPIRGSSIIDWPIDQLPDRRVVFVIGEPEESSHTCTRCKAPATVAVTIALRHRWLCDYCESLLLALMDKRLAAPMPPGAG